MVRRCVSDDRSWHILDRVFLVNPEYVIYYLIVINFITFAAYGSDKAKAERGKSRTSEQDLLFYALIGGTPAAYAARELFRHKTRKQPFSNRLHMIAMAQLVGVVFLGVLFV